MGREQTMDMLSGTTSEHLRVFGLWVSAAGRKGKPDPGMTAAGGWYDVVAVAAERQLGVGGNLTA